MRPWPLKQTQTHQRPYQMNRRGQKLKSTLGVEDRAFTISSHPQDLAADEADCGIRRTKLPEERNICLNIPGTVWPATADTLCLIQLVMAGPGGGAKISQGKRCEPTRARERRVRKHTGTRQTVPPFTHTGSPLFPHLCQSTMRLSDTKAPLCTSRI